mmetsp:Transcript_8329/g.9956  ORF Transcript_8329/g.9956 Transcript_8329/m.9956 type:complete len:979 (+) Transcript_8329:94-3030(+)
MGDIEEHIQKLREHVPDDKTNDDIRKLIEETGGDEAAIQGKIAEWWEASAGAEEEDTRPQAPENEAPPPEKKEEKPKKSSSGKSKRSSTSGGQDKEMMDFRHLMVKGLELKKATKSGSEKCVIYMDVTCRTFFCAKQKNAPSAKAYRVEEIAEASANGDNEKIITIVHKDGSLDLEVSSPKVRDYLVRMLNKLFTLEKTKAADGGGDEGGGKKSSRGSTRPKKDKGRSDDRIGSGRSGRIQVSQVKLLAEHCYSMNDDQIDEMVSAKIPTHSRWESYQEFKDKINRRDELIRSLQDGLGTINTERVRFQRACEDIELHHQDELQELKQHLAMALTSFQELQRASEHRESEMREALKGAHERSNKFETEKDALLASMNDQRVNGAASAKEAEMLKEAIGKVQTDLEKKTAEYEDARKRFSQVKEALTVERNLRARAEIKEEQMRQEIIATTGQMHAMRDKFVGDIEVNTEEVENRTAELTEKIEGMETDLKEKNETVSKLEAEVTTLQGEVSGLKSALDGASAKASELSSLAEKAGQVDGLKLQISRLEEEMAATSGASKAEVEELKETIKEQEERLLAADDERRKMHNIIQELRGNIRVYIRVRPFLSSDQGVNIEGKLDPAVMVKQDGVTAEIKRLEEGEIVESHKWEFDKSFPCPTTQDDIFLEVREFVQSALDGYNVCLFSYGQTGSGKTHTMQGYGKGDMRGIIPRSIEQVGQTKLKLIEQGWEFEMKVQYVEIYNEIVRDLLNETGEKASLRILRDAYGMTEIEEVVTMAVAPENKSEIDNIMDIAARNRSVCKTDMNAESSRSHSIFTLHLVASNESQNAVLRGQLNLCDLAGSERVDRSGAQGKALAEAKNINKSLACLTGVFASINSKSQHIPFRDSKLTYLLQPSFSGDGKTLMMINLSPTELSHFESLSTLRFGAMVNSCELGRATKNLNDIDVDKKKQKKGAGDGDDKKGASDKEKKGARGKSPPRR